MNAPKCEAFEVDEFGQPVNAREYVTSANFPLEFLHIEPAFNGYIACGFTNNGSTTVPVVAVLSPALDVVEARVYPGFYLDEDNATYTANGVAMHITTDGQQGFVVSGIIGDDDLLQSGAAGKRFAMAMRLKPDLSVEWVRAFSGGAPWSGEDMDAFNHGADILDGTKFFFSGSFNSTDCNQEAAAVMLDGSGNLSWAYRYSNQDGGAHNSLSGDIVFDNQSEKIHQLVNNSITHTWGLATWDLSGNLDLGKTWNSQYSDLNWQGLSLLQSPLDPNKLIVGGFQRTHGWSGFYGSVPFLTEIKLNSGSVSQSSRYLIPQNNGLINASVDALSLFNGQQAQFRQPTMAVHAPDGIFFHGYRGVGATGFSTNGVETAVARSPLGETLCDWEYIPTNLYSGDWEVEDGILAIEVTLDVGSFAITSIASDFVTESCEPVTPLVCEEVFDPSFTWSYGPGLTCPSGCEIIFDNFISPDYDPSIHCLEWDFGDGTTMAMSGALSQPFTYCYTSLAGSPPGFPDVCLTVKCCDDASINSVYCDTLTINCGTPDPCPPLEGVYSIDAFLTNGFSDCSEGCTVGFDCPVLDPALYCYEWNFGDGTTSSGVAGVCPIHCYEESGTYEACLTITCCDDGTSLLVLCTEVVVDCGSSCPPIEGFYYIEGVVSSSSPNCEEGCAVGFDCPNLDNDLYCYHWDFGDGTTWTETAGSCPIHCYDESGAYDVCLTITCCEDGAELLVLCTEVVVECGSCKLPDPPSISMDVSDLGSCGAGNTPEEGCVIGVCGLYNPDLNEGLLDPFDLCADFFFSDGSSIVGVPFAACYEHCFDSSGEYEICMEVYCCSNPNERIVVCESLICGGCPVECSVGNAFWVVNQTLNDDGCLVQLEGTEFLGPGMTEHQNPVWKIDGVVSALTYSASFTLEPGVYSICRSVEGVAPDGSICLSEHCHDVSVNCCGDECPGDFDGNGVINISDLLGLLSVFGESCF